MMKEYYRFFIWNFLILILDRGLPYFSIFIYAQCITMYYGNMVSSILYLNIEHIYSHIVENLCAVFSHLILA